MATAAVPGEPAAGVPVAVVRLQDLLNAAERHSASRWDHDTPAAPADDHSHARNHHRRAPESLLTLHQQQTRQRQARDVPHERMVDLDVDHLVTYSEQASSARSSVNGSSEYATGNRRVGGLSTQQQQYLDPHQITSATERLSHAETAASLAKRRNKSPQQSSRQHRRPPSTRRDPVQNNDPPHSALGVPPPRIGTEDEGQLHGRQHQVRREAKSSEAKAQTPPVLSTSSHGNPPLAPVLSSALSTSSMVLARRRSDVALPRDVSPSVVLLGVGTSLDQKRIALSNAELRRQLRILKQQNQKHEAERQRIEHVQRSDDTIDGIQRDAEMLGEQIAQAAETHAALASEMEQLSKQKNDLQQQVNAERWTRNSVQRVLFDRSDSFKEWKRAVALEKQRREEARIHEILQRQLAAASAGDRRIRPVREVRQERDELRELVQTLRGEKSDLESALREMDRDIEEAKVRAQSLLAADDEVEERIDKLKVYMATVKKVLGE